MSLDEIKDSGAAGGAVAARAPEATKTARAGFPWLAAGITVCLAICCGLLLKIAYRAGRDLPFFRVDASQSLPVQFPEWLPREWIAEAKFRISERNNFSVFDDAAIEALRQDLQKLPWVKSVRESDRGLPRTLKLAITPRTPIALVETKTSLILVDSDGVVLPPAVFPADRLDSLPRIVKWRGEFTDPDAGVRWENDAVLDGISVALLLPQLYFHQLLNIDPGFRVSRIDVSNCGGVLDRRETEILLITNTGVKIKWGRAPRSAKFGELTPDQKFKNLARILEEYAGLGGVGAINLRFDQADVFDAQGQWIPRPALLSQAVR